MRKSFSLITAIIILVIISTLMVVMLSLSTQTAKQTGDIYLKEQVELLAKSATEYAILAIQGHDNKNSCINSINIKYPVSTNPQYDINVSIYYIGNNLPCDSDHILANNIATSDSNGTVIIDTIVTNLQSDEPIRYHRRTIQKP
ncbi:hypothetical protein [Nitrosophilus kaiyonis]|uniref:hypothetical protein n=1 Tax=Nitrosophilus kaiyonis TaxID=2930200 RepID=UPI0024928082|nr:hypothetical protein [Nitrosophilus kaiyonis]